MDFVYRKPQVQVLGTDDYLLTEPFHYQWAAQGRKWAISVPANFRFDGASIPWIGQLFVGKWDLGLAPPLVHDWIYRWEGSLPTGSFKYWNLVSECWENDSRIWTRKNTDRLFARHMRYEQVARWKRRSSYIGVRAWGWKAWYGL